MRKVPREAFIPKAVRRFAYEDRPLPIGWGQTISQPYMVGLMTQLLNPEKTGHILEIGTGSGYQSAVLAELAESVNTIEIIPELVQRSRAILAQLGYTNVRVIEGDGSKGWPEPQTFDGILITCATPIIPEALLVQLKPGGTLIAPVGGVDEQKLSAYIKNEKLERKTIIKVRFVPMLTAYSLQENDNFICSL
jgi:protein-L-isoaspartate(D-aspartate) O-methyltransferase